jgi:hypothetical protein
MRKFIVQILLVVVDVALPGSGWSHDFWIEPNRFILEEPGKVQLMLKEGVDLKGNSLPYITDWFEDFTQTDSTGRAAINSILGNDPAASVELTDGLTVIGYQSQRNFVDLGPEKFTKYLRDEGMDYVFKLREERGESDQNALEYFVRCAKSMLQTGDSSSGELYTTQLGYALELIPETDPYQLSPGNELGLRLLYLGAPIEDIRIRAFTKDLLDQPIDARTASDGRVVLTLPRAGKWLIKAVHLIPIKNDPKARWESFWASLTFELR